MKINVIQNGSLKLSITPETELEKITLQTLFQGPVEVTHHEKLQLLDKALVDTIVIAPVAKKEE